MGACPLYFIVGLGPYKQENDDIVPARMTRKYVASIITTHVGEYIVSRVPYLLGRITRWSPVVKRWF